MDKVKIKVITVSFEKSISYLGSSYIEWIREFEAGENDMVIIVDECIQYHKSIPCKYKIPMLLEPEGVRPNEYKYIRENLNEFKCVLTHSKEIIELLDACNSPAAGLWFPPSTTWIQDREIVSDKTHWLSMIASTKNYTSGQIFRNQIIKKIERSKYIKNNIHIFGSGRNFIKNKEDGLKPYMFSIVVENERTNDYFTEKILDCFATGTVPIYWGTENIENYFDKDGIITFSTWEELDDILNRLSPSDYERRKTAIFNNFYITDKYLTSTDDWLFKAYPSIFGGGK